VSRVVLPDRPVGPPVSTIVSVTPILCNEDRWAVALACGHGWRSKGTRAPRVGARRTCAECARLRTPRAYLLVQQMAGLGLTVGEVEYLAGRLAEQRDRKDGGR
jgi:hypothetical protein